MQDWHSTCLGRRTLPRDLSAFEIEAFFNFTDAERVLSKFGGGTCAQARIALQIGFSAHDRPPPRSGAHRATGIVGGIWVSNSASLRQTWHRCDHNVGARCSSTRKWPARTLGFHWLSEAQRRALVRVLRGETDAHERLAAAVAVCASLALRASTDRAARS